MNTCLRVISGLIAGTILSSAEARVACPIPHEHMKAEYFSISKHEATTHLQNRQTGFTWTVTIRTNNLILDKSVVEQFIRANKSQEYAYEGGGLGSYKYKCNYINPFPYSANFIAGSNG